MRISKNEILQAVQLAGPNIENFKKEILQAVQVGVQQ